MAHRFLQTYRLMTKTTPKKIPARRNGFYYINGKVYPSVTKIIGDVLAKPALPYWYAREAARIALADPALNEKEVTAQLQLNIRQSQERGKTVHALAEIMPNVDLDKIGVNEKGYVTALAKWWKVHKPEPIFREMELYSDTLDCAGRADFVCIIGMDVWLIDFKTGNAVYPEAGIQECVYDFMLKERGLATPNHRGTVLLMETGEWLFKETHESIDTFRHIRAIWDWMQSRKETAYAQ